MSDGPREKSGSDLSKIRLRSVIANPLRCGDDRLRNPVALPGGGRSFSRSIYGGGVLYMTKTSTIFFFVLYRYILHRAQHDTVVFLFGDDG